MIQSLDFRALVRPVPRRSVFALEDWYVWGGSMVRTADGVCHLLFSRWPRSLGHNAWVTHSEIAYATADDPLGPYTLRGVALGPRGGDYWDAEVTHNPTVMEAGGRYYLYYMGTRGPGGWWDYRNHQRIGVAVADHPAGPWQRFDRPVLDVTSDAWDCLMTSNPSCTPAPDGRFLMLYKGVGAGPMPKGGAVLCGAAWAEHPCGPFAKQPGPVIVNPEHPWAVEDAYVWHQDDRFYCIIKDYHGYFTRTGDSSLALFESRDGAEWRPAAHPLALQRTLTWEDGEVEQVANLERPQLWLQQGRPAVLFCACDNTVGRAHSFNVHIPLV